jgi:hypothetical protein
LLDWAAHKTSAITVKDDTQKQRRSRVDQTLESSTSDPHGLSKTTVQQ